MPRTENPQPRWASLAEASEHLGVSQKTLRRMISSGTVTGYRVGPRLLRVDLRELDATPTVVPAAR